MSNSSQSHLRFPRRSFHKAIQTILVGGIAVTGLLTGLVPSLNVVRGLELGLQQAQAQSQSSFSNEEITNYARAVLALEARRHQVFNEIKKIVGSVPRIVCNEQSSIEALPGATPQRLATSYCEEAEKIVEMKGLTINRFNEITDRQQGNPQLRQRIQAEILRLQQPGR